MQIDKNECKNRPTIREADASPHEAQKDNNQSLRRLRQPLGTYLHIVKMRLKRFFALPPEPIYRFLTILAVLLCFFVLYGFRALQAEILRWGFLAAFILLGCGGLVLIGIACWLVLFLFGIRGLLSSQPNGVLFFTLIIGALLAWYLPEPPMREEIKLFFNRSRYEQIVEQGRPIYLSGGRDCMKLSDKDRQLTFTCVFVADNYAEFYVYRDVFSLVYSYDKQPPKAVECDWNGYVWKQIDENWFICKSDIN